MESVTDAAAAGVCVACSAVALVTLTAGVLKAFIRFDAWNEGQRLRMSRSGKGEAEAPRGSGHPRPTTRATPPL